MITLDGITENVIAEIIVVGLSLLISKFAPNIILKKEKIGERVNFDFLHVSIFLTLISIANLILNLSFWNNPNLNILFVLCSIGFGMLTVFVYENQCPSCKKFIRAKKKINDQIIKRFTREWKYQPMKIFLYSNSQVWKRIPIGKEQIRIENWITKQEFYKCNYCNYEWDSGHLDINLDEKTRPKPKVIKTNKVDPNEPRLNY